MTYFESLDEGAQPICPSCGVTTNPTDDGQADECLECGWRIEHTDDDEAPTP